MPCYNAERYVGFAIKSILDQSYRNFELIVIDDGSTDNTNEKIRNLQDPRIRYIGLMENSGNYVARNIGVKAANGAYICVMDAEILQCLTGSKRNINFWKAINWLAA